MQQGIAVVLIGHANHSEVEGTMVRVLRSYRTRDLCVLAMSIVTLVALSSVPALASCVPGQACAPGVAGEISCLRNEKANIGQELSKLNVKLSKFKPEAVRMDNSFKTDPGLVSYNKSKCATSVTYGQEYLNCGAIKRYWQRKHDEIQSKITELDSEYTLTSACITKNKDRLSEIAARLSFLASDAGKATNVDKTLDNTITFCTFKSSDGRIWPSAVHGHCDLACSQAEQLCENARSGQCSKVKCRETHK